VTWDAPADTLPEMAKKKGKWKIHKVEKGGVILRRESTVLAAYASGYPPYYKSDEEEVSVISGESRKKRNGELGTGDPSNPLDYWWPRTADFQAEAQTIPDAEVVGVADLQALVAAIRARKNLQAAFWYGHGASGELQFGRSRFTAGDLGSLAGNDLSSHFSADGQIIFVSCNTDNMNSTLLQGIANALRVRVRGFNTGVRWEVQWDGETPRRKITHRGMGGASRSFTSAGTPHIPQ
jgi:hypothetical protein